MTSNSPNAEPVDLTSGRRAATAAVTDWVVRHPLVTLGLCAFLIRIVVAVVLQGVGSSDLVQDDRVYVELVRAKLDGSLTAQDPYYRELYSSVWAFIEPLTLTGRVFGVHYLVGEVIIALWAALAVVATTMIALRVLDNRHLAIAAGIVPAVLPSQILWSSVWLKDAAVAACLALVVLAIAIAYRAESTRGYTVGVALGGVALLTLSGLRLNSFVVTCWCVTIVLLASFRLNPLAIVAAVVAVTAVPWVGGAGIGGMEALRVGEDLGTKRAAGAVGADSALVRVATSAGGADTSNSAGANLAYLPKGLEAVLVRPTPWEQTTSKASLFAKIDNLLWYPILLLALIGSWRAWRQPDTLLLVLISALTVGVYALSEGNLGTAFRHRGEIVWAAAILACIGLARVAKYRQLRNGHPLTTTQKASV